MTDNISIGRPEQIALVFARQVRTTTKGVFRTRVFDAGTDVKLDFSYKHSRIKQYRKDGRALRIEAVINKPADVRGWQRGSSVSSSRSCSHAL